MRSLWWDDFCRWIRPACSVHLKKGIVFGNGGSLVWRINRPFVFLQTLTWHCKICVTEIARHTQKPSLSIYPHCWQRAAQMLEVVVSQEEVKRNPSTPPSERSGVRQMNASSGARELRLNGQQAVQGVPLFASRLINSSSSREKWCHDWLTTSFFFNIYQSKKKKKKLEKRNKCKQIQLKSKLKTSTSERGKLSGGILNSPLVPGLSEHGECQGMSPSCGKYLVCLEVRQGSSEKSEEGG